MFYSVRFSFILLHVTAETKRTIAFRDRPASIPWSKPFGIFLHVPRFVSQMLSHPNLPSFIQPDRMCAAAIPVLTYLRPPCSTPSLSSNKDPISRTFRSTTTHRLVDGKVYWAQRVEGANSIEQLHVSCDSLILLALRNINIILHHLCPGNFDVIWKVYNLIGSKYQQISMKKYTSFYCTFLILYYMFEFIYKLYCLYY